LRCQPPTNIGAPGERRDRFKWAVVVNQWASLEVFGDNPWNFDLNGDLRWWKVKKKTPSQKRRSVELFHPTWKTAVAVNSHQLYL